MGALQYGFVRSHADYSLFTYKRSEKFMALLVYVDDIVLTRNDSALCAQFKNISPQLFSYQRFWASQIFSRH